MALVEYLVSHNQRNGRTPKTSFGPKSVALEKGRGSSVREAKDVLRQKKDILHLKLYRAEQQHRQFIQTSRRKVVAAYAQDQLKDY